MEVPPHFFHPFVIHGPLIFPFVLFLVCLFRLENLSSVKNELLALVILQIGLAAWAFYSGSWTTDGIIEDVHPTAKEALEWHYFWGRVLLLASLVTGGAIFVGIIAVRHEKTFAALALLMSLFLCLLSIFTGATGGSIVHEYGMNTLLIPPENI